jgi:hypothetical protein
MNIKALALSVLVVFGPAALLAWGLFIEAGGLPLTIWLFLIIIPIVALALAAGVFRVDSYYVRGNEGMAEGKIN